MVVGGGFGCIRSQLGLVVITQVMYIEREEKDIRWRCRDLPKIPVQCTRKANRDDGHGLGHTHGFNYHGLY